MYSENPPPICSVCNSRRNERFVRSDSKGIRCLDCGHEMKTETHHPYSGPIKWERAETDNTF